MHSNGPDGADHGWIKRTELTGELETDLEKLEEVYTCDYSPGFQNKVLTKGTVYTKYIYGNKIVWIIFTRSIKHYMSLIN